MININFPICLAPSRFDELPALVPDFDSTKWPILKDNLITDKYSMIAVDNAHKQFCVHIHSFYAEEFIVIMRYLKPSLSIIGGLIITIPHEKKYLAEEIEKQIEKFGVSRKTKIIFIDNIGRNIKPLLIDAWEEISKYKYCLHLHTKRTKGKGGNYGGKWLGCICNSIASEKGIKSALTLLETDNRLGIILPRPFEETAEHSLSWAGTSELMYKQISSFLKYIGRESISELEFYSKVLVYGVGGMMLFRVDSLNPMQSWIKMNQEYVSIPEPLPTQSSLHALERLFVWCPGYSNYSWCLFDKRENNLHVLRSSDYNIFKSKPCYDVYVKSINASVFDKDYIANRVLKLEAQLLLHRRAFKRSSWRPRLIYILRHIKNKLIHLFQR